MSDEKKSSQGKFELGRRELLAGAGAAGLAGIIGAAPRDAEAGAHSGGNTGISAAQSGVYETVPLRQSSINVAAIQSRVRAVDIRNLKRSMQANLDHVVKLINYAQGSPEAWDGERRWGAKQDLICMHEFPVQGFQPWTRRELNQIAFELPGPEVEVIAERAKHFG
jgi:hypothetical protein